MTKRVFSEIFRALCAFPGRRLAFETKRKSFVSAILQCCIGGKFSYWHWNCAIYRRSINQIAKFAFVKWKRTFCFRNSDILKIPQKNFIQVFTLVSRFERKNLDLSSCLRYRKLQRRIHKYSINTLYIISSTSREYKSK